MRGENKRKKAKEETSKKAEENRCTKIVTERQTH
jgi:hypothetical protein